MKNSIKLNNEVVESKGFELDVNVKTKDGIIYIRNAKPTNLKSMGDYCELKPVTLINFVKSMSVHNTGNAINEFGVINRKYPNDYILPQYLTYRKY